MLKKVVAVLLSAALALSAVGCGQAKSSSSAAQESAAQGSAASGANSASASGVKIGLSIYATTDATSGPMVKNMQAACDGMGAKLVVATDGQDLEKEVTNIENLIANGCKAVFCLPYSDDSIPRIVSTCENAGVYFGFYWYDLTNKATHDACYNSKYFLGNVYEDDVWSAYTAMQTLHKAGASNIGMFGLPTGRTTTDKRDKGIQKASQEFNMKVLVTDRVNTNTSDAAASSVESMISAYPNLDGIVIAGMTQTCLPGVVQSLTNLHKNGKIKVSCIDFNENQTNYFNKGLINGVIGGHFTGCAWLANLAINKLQGTPLTDKAVSIQDQFIVLQSKTDAQNYDAHLYNELPYTTEEFAKMSKKTNPSFTYEQLLKVIKDYSISDVMTRHGIK